MILLLWLVEIAGVVFFGIVGIKVHDQRYRDRKRKTYRLNFPGDLSPEQVVTWLRSISGTLRGGKYNLTGAPTLAFETFATTKGIIHRLKVPYGHEPYIIPQLRVSGINATPEDEFEDRNWLHGVEVGIKNTSRQLRVYEPADVSTSILSCLQSLQPDEALLIQWVVTPAAPVKLPEHGAPTHELDWNGIWTHGVRVKAEASKDEVRDRRDKLAEPNFNVVLRVAGSAETEPAARGLVERIRMALAAVRGPTIRFHKRLVRIQKLRDHIRKAHSPLIMPGQLSAPELAAMIAWPMGRPQVAGLAPVMARHLPPSAVIPSAGRKLGVANMPGAERPVAISYPNCLRHTYVIGGTGSGKSVLLANMLGQDMRNGNGVILFDAKSDKDALFYRALDVIPEDRLDDVIILNIEDTDYPVGFNILDQGNSFSSISNMSSLISTMYGGTSTSVTAPRTLYHMLHALAETPGHTFIDLPILIENYPKNSPEGQWQDSVIRNVKNADIKSFMQQWTNKTKPERDRDAGPVYNRTWEFTNRPEIKRILGQRKSSFKMVDVIRDNKILLVYVNGAKIGEQTAALIGTLIVNAIWEAVQQVQPEKANFLYLDEFADFINLPISTEAMLTKARGSNLGLVLAHQHMKQLSPEVKEAVLSNTATKIIFKTGKKDGTELAGELPGGIVTVEDLKSLARYETMCSIATDTGTSPPVTVRAYPPPRNSGNAAKAIALSRAKYGRPLEDVTRDIDNRPGGHAEPAGGKNRPRPPLSGWNG